MKNILKPVYIFFVNHVGINRFLTFITFYVVTGALDGNLIMGVVSGYIVFKIFNPVRLQSGDFTVKDVTYSYVYGDRMNIAGEKMHGVQVSLPAVLPHIFIDLHRNDGTWGLQRSFNDIKKYDLEGDFGTETTVYANLVDKLEVLSVLQPNVMSTILDKAKDYDIEIIENKLMLYSRKKIFYKQSEVARIIAAAQAVTSTMQLYLQRGKYVDRHVSGPMQQVQSDRLVKFKNYGVGSVRKIVALLLLLIINLAFLPIFKTAIFDPELNGAYNNIMFIFALIFWVCTIIPVLYIGLSRKKIDIRL